jgi:tRNA G18 (ribose-2'-O)-methylase SpoU
MPKFLLKRIKEEQVENAERVPLIVLVDNVRSLYNVGSIFEHPTEL